MIIVSIIILFFSCSNDIKNVIKVSEFEKLPELTGENIHFTQSEYGKIVISISTPYITKNNIENKSEQMEFKKGLCVVQYSSYPDTLSLISANYAINYTDDGLWEAKGNVIAKNMKNQETLNTEYLVWDQKKGIIYSDKKVKVSTPDDIIIGEGFKSDEQFNDWQVEKVTGVISFDEEDQTNTDYDSTKKEN